MTVDRWWGDPTYCSHEARSARKIDAAAHHLDEAIIELRHAELFGLANYLFGFAVELRQHAEWCAQTEKV